MGLGRELRAVAGVHFARLLAFAVSQRRVQSTQGVASPVASASGPSAPTSAASGSSSGGTGQITGGSGGGLVFNNTFNSSCTAAYKACVVAAEDELSTLFTNSDTINLSFHEANSGKGNALGNNWASWKTVSYATLKGALPSSDGLPGSKSGPVRLQELVPSEIVRENARAQ